MIGELLITPDEHRRQALYQRLFTSLAEQAVYIPLTYSRTKAIYRSELENVGLIHLNMKYLFEKMRFKAE